MKDKEKTKKYLDIIRITLSQIVGADYTDIQPEDSITEDLHMGPTEITDFIQSMSQKGFEIPESVFEEISTVDELAEYLQENE